MSLRPCLAAAVPVAALAALVTAAPALAAPAQVSVETTARLGYDMNPFLTSGNDVASPYAEVSVSPSIRKRTEKGEVALTGHYDRTEYFERYGTSDQYGAGAELQQRLTPKLNIFAALRYDSAVVGQNDDAVSGAPIDNTDVNLIGQRRRSDTYSASGGYQYQLTPKDMISADGGYTATRYRNGPGGNDSTNVGGRIAWTHAINERTKIGISGSAYRIDYDTPGLLSMVMQPAVTFSTELSATWHFDASLGVSFSRLWLPAPLADDRTKGFSGTVNLCHKSPTDNFCLYGDRSVSASGIGGTTVRSQLGFNYRRKMTEKVGFTAGGSYSRSESQANLVSTREYVSARAGLDWQVSRRLKLGSEGRYRDVFGQPGAVKSDIGGEIYATLALPGPK